MFSKNGSLTSSDKRGELSKEYCQTNESFFIYGKQEHNARDSLFRKNPAKAI